MRINRYWLMGFLCGIVATNSAAIRLPSSLYRLENGQAFSTLSIKESTPIFYILVPESSTLPTLNTQKLNEFSAFMKDTVVPQDFFTRNYPQQASKPVTLFFNWQEQENSKTRKQAGINLAKGINSLRRRFKKSPIIIVGHGQGGNVINVASHSVSLPLNTVIQISTPIFPHDKNKKKDLYAHYIPDNKMITQMFSFYSEQAFPILHPTLHPQYQQVYQATVHPNLTNVLLLINNKHPLPNETLRPLVGKKLLPLCQSIRLSYRVHNNLVAHLSTVKKETDLIVVLRDGTIRKTSSKNPATKKIAQERVLSRFRMEIFTKKWGRPLSLTLAKGEKSRKRYESIKQTTSGQKKS